MDSSGLDAVLGTFLTSRTAGSYAIDTSRILPGLTTFLIRSFDGDALQFSFPLVVHRDFFSETALDPAGADGATWALIEQIKDQAETVPALGPLYGKGTQVSARCRDTIEPYTLIHTDDGVGSHLWKPDGRNFCDHEGVHLVIRGALPGSEHNPERRQRDTLDALSGLAEAISTIVDKSPLHRVEAAWLASLDQKLFREMLKKRGLVSFVGDGSRLARTLTHHRCFYRVAGPKEGVNVPFRCPRELEPVEIALPASNRTVTGLGIRKKEILAVAGSNAQGKSTFLEGILAGMDDHAPRDGREDVVTVKGARIAESSGIGLAGADISMFFHALPPGVSGTVRSVHGIGSGSMSMAHQVQNAVTCHAPLLIIDEDRAAPNLLVKSCLQDGNITPLCEILARNRDRMGGTTLVFAACAMDMLIARADRIMVFDRHEAMAVRPQEFRARVAALLRKTADDLEI